MKFYMPTKVYSEQGAVMNHRNELAALGGKALIVTGRHSSHANGSLKDVTDALDAEKKPYSIFNEIEENPSVELIVRAAEYGKEEGADFVIGIGGGSPLDASKAIAILLKNPQLDGSVFYKKVELEAVNVAAVPTTAGTGSEVTPYAILTRHDQQTKQSIAQKIFPQVALIDSRYIATVSMQVRINTAIDALAHLLESWLNSNATSYSRMICEYALKLFSGVKENLLSKTQNAVCNETLMTISTMAGMAISHTGTSLPHGMSYALTYHHNIPHGRAVGMFLPSYLKNNPNKQDTIYLLSLMGFKNEQQFDEFIFHALGTAVLSDEQIHSYTAAMMANKAKLANCPYTVTAKIMEEMYASAVRQ